MLDNIIIKSSYPVQETFLQVYQADLASIGVTMNPKLVDAATWLDQANNVKYTGMWASGDNYSNLNPGSLFAVSPGWRAFPNNDGFKDPRWAELVGAANTRVGPGQAETALLGHQRLRPGPVLHLRRVRTTPSGG